MRKFLLLAGIFTVLACNTAKAERYYEEDGYYYREQPRYTRSVEYASDREYQKPQPRYERVRRSEVREVREPQYHKKEYVQYEEPNKIRPYIGIDVATSKMDFGDDQWVKDYDGGDNYFDDGNTSLSFVVGAKFNKHFGLEAFYQKSVDGKNELGFDYGEDLWAKDETSLSYTAMGVDAIGYLPINQDFELLASLGLAHYDFESKADYSSYSAYDDYGYVEGSDTKDFKSLGVRVGIGAQYNLTNNLAIRGMARYIKMNDDDYVKSLTELSLGLRYMF